MSGYTKADLKKLAKDGGYHVTLLANEVLVLREINGEIRKYGHRAAEEIESLTKRLEEAEKVIEFYRQQTDRGDQSEGSRKYQIQVP